MLVDFRNAGGQILREKGRVRAAALRLRRERRNGGISKTARRGRARGHQDLIFETNEKKPLIVLMHGDRQVSTKSLARHWA